MAEINAVKMQSVVKAGFGRLKAYRAARAMFLREFVGQYYNKFNGLTGEEPINLIFHTIRTFVPNLVLSSPVNQVYTQYTSQQQYAEVLSLGLDTLQEDIGMKQILRAWVIDALFAWGILKTSVAVSGQYIKIGDVDVDPGQIYTELIDLDDFVVDPVCTSISKATFMGHAVRRVPREFLLDSNNGFNHDLVRRLPQSKSGMSKNELASRLSINDRDAEELISLQDAVDVVELWIPEAEAIVTIADPMQVMLPDYLKVGEYYGPKEGSYTFLSFTPKVSNNLLPIAAIGLWYDIHRMANRLLQKRMEQADAQKDVMLYNPAQADEAVDILEARSGDSVASTDPNGVKVVSFGGNNNPTVDLMVQELQSWYNYMAGNPDQLAGIAGQARETATKSNILQGNASISIEDARDLLYDATAEVSRKQAWYLHHDPLMQITVGKRLPGGEREVIELTPEMRDGDFLNLRFKIKQRSMSRLSPDIRSKRIVEFATNILPSVMNSAMICMQMGVPFNVQRTVTDIATMLDIGDEVMDWFNDPEFVQKLEYMLMMGPQPSGNAKSKGPASMAATQQNGGLSSSVPIPGQQTINNQAAQSTAAMGQSAYGGNY